MTVYGKGGQTRGFLNIRDTLRCVELFAVNPPARGEFRVANQFTEQFSVMELAERVQSAAKLLGIQATVCNIDNPRVEKEEHYYNAKNTTLQSLGLEPHLLTGDVISSMFGKIMLAKNRIDHDIIRPTVCWKRRDITI